MVARLLCTNGADDGIHSTCTKRAVDDGVNERAFVEIKDEKTQMRRIT